MSDNNDLTRFIVVQTLPDGRRRILPALPVVFVDDEQERTEKRTQEHGTLSQWGTREPRIERGCLMR